MSLSFPSRFFEKIAALFGLCFGLLAASLHAEVRTLTDKEGRSLQAEVISVDGDTVTIKREDGQTFTLPLSTLGDDDQKSLKDWAAQQASKPKTLPASAIGVELSRGIFKTEKRKVDVTLTTGVKVKDGMTITEDKWGYAVTLSNHTSQPISNLKAEYRLFATVDDIQVKSSVKQGLKKKSYKSVIDAVPSLDHVVFRTETISAIKSKYNGNIVAAKSGESSSRETLYGIWIRIYDGDNLVCETASPESLSTTEKW